MKILYYIYQICIALTYFIGIDYPHGNRHYRRFSPRRSSLLGILSRQKYGHNSSVFFY